MPQSTHVVFCEHGGPPPYCASSLGEAKAKANEFAVKAPNNPFRICELTTVCIAKGEVQVSFTNFPATP